MKSLSSIQLRSIERELQDGEQIGWAGGPSRVGVILDQAPGPLVTLFFSAIALRNIVNFQPNGMPNIADNVDLAAWGFAILLILICAMMFGSALWRICSTGRTSYAVTSRRILIITHFIRREVISIYPNAINALERSSLGGGSGSITFRREIVGTGEDKQTKKIKFIGISDIDGASRQIELLRRSGENLSV